MSEETEAQFKNPGECINFAENKEISKELRNFSDYAKGCTPGKNK